MKKRIAVFTASMCILSAIGSLTANAQSVNETDGTVPTSQNINEIWGANEFDCHDVYPDVKICEMKDEYENEMENLTENHDFITGAYWIESKDYETMYSAGFATLVLPVDMIPNRQRIFRHFRLLKQKQLLF